MTVGERSCVTHLLGKQSWTQKFREKLGIFWGFGEGFRGILVLFSGILQYFTLDYTILRYFPGILRYFPDTLRYFTLYYATLPKLGSLFPGSLHKAP